ncbi:MAG: FecR domain-containing protein [Acidobacteriota bacterium]
MRETLPLALIAITASLSWGQSAIAARAGMIHYAEGAVNLDGQTLSSDPSDLQEFKFVNEGETLNTTRGRAEILLNPGSFLRVSENSSVRLISSTLEDTRIQLVTGKALIEVSEFNKDNLIVVQVGDVYVRLQKHGLYQFSVGPARVRVYDGEASISGSGSDSTTDGVRVRKGNEAALEGTAVQIATIQPTKFDREETDALYRWSARRDRVLAQVNQSSALLASSNGYRSQGGLSSWAWNPSYGMYTFLPGNGYGYSPFDGIQYYSPVTIVYLTQSPVSINQTSDNNLGRLTPANSTATATATDTSPSIPIRSSAPVSAAPVSAEPATGGRKR